MSYIPAKKMPHVTARSGEFDAETGKIIHLHPEAKPAPSRPGLNWIAGVAGASLAAAVALGAFFALRSSSSRTPTRRRTGTAAKRAAKKNTSFDHMERHLLLKRKKF